MTADKTASRPFHVDVPEEELTDGLDIHFIHVCLEHDNALPLIVTHGWPGSVVEQLKIVDPLTNPTAHGASASDAFHLVPSMPGYGLDLVVPELQRCGRYRLDYAGTTQRDHLMQER